MTPAARLSAAIAVLDRILAGANVERALTNWGRASRFAGSSDRNAVRDLVYDALRRKRSAACLGGGMSGRGLVLGLIRQRGEDPGPSFSGQGHAPQPIAATESGQVPQGLESLDCPDWLGPALKDSLGPDFDATMTALQDRAPVYVRVNTRRCTRDQAVDLLAQDGIAAHPTKDVKTGLQVTKNARKILTSHAYVSGLIELQDLSSQAVVQALPLSNVTNVLDYCAGGGGKALAISGLCGARINAFDINPARMNDLPERARRAGAQIRILRDPSQFSPYDLVLCDAPCSGSGSWRRDPQGKWALTPKLLSEVVSIQAQVLDNASTLVKRGGILAYATCSMLRVENEDQIAAFVQRNPNWICTRNIRFSPLSGGDGFFLAILGYVVNN